VAECAAVRLLADEADRARPELDGQPLEALCGAYEIARAQVARTRRRPEGGVREADPVAENLELLGRREEPRREAGVAEKPPEVVAGVREMRGRRGRHAAGVAPAEDQVQIGRKHVRYAAGHLE